jgi:hypothetical protein
LPLVKPELQILLKMRHFALTVLALIISLGIFAQNPGDTIEIRSFNYTQTYGSSQWSPGIRDTVIDFPSDTTTYEKILMLYNIRCKDGKVSSGSQRNIGCGEWDVSCNTYIHDSSKVDSVISYHSSHSISPFSGSVFPYVASPLYDYYQYYQKTVSINSVQAETLYVAPPGTTSFAASLPAGTKNYKTKFLITAAELSSLGMTAGNINGLVIYGDSGTLDPGFFKIRLMEVPFTSFSDSMALDTGWQEVYFKDSHLDTGANKLYFYTPFNWNGTSNIAVELSSTNPSALPKYKIDGRGSLSVTGLILNNDASFVFNGTNYLECNSYKGVAGNNPRTIEAWIRTTVPNKEIISWGRNSSGKKWIFRVDATGVVRIEIYGWATLGTTVVSDGKWHHVACTYSGGSQKQVKLIVDGIVEKTTTISKTVNTDTTSGIKVRVSRGVNNRYFIGQIDEVRLWDTVLTEQTISRYRYANISSSHPCFNHLKLYYRLDENGGSVIHDSSPAGNDAHVVNAVLWQTLRGDQLFKNQEESAWSPRFGLLRGNYSLTVNTDTILDSVQIAAKIVKQYAIETHPGTLQSDVVIVVTDTMFWEANNEMIYNSITGTAVDSILVTPDDTINITELTYYKRYPAKYEIMSFVTPYGLGLNLGMGGKTYTFDVSDYAPVLRGKKRMTVERGGQWQEDMDIRFLFIVGTPPHNVIDIRQMWRPGITAYYNSIISDRIYEQRNVTMNPQAVSFKIRSAITGHGQEGEFIPRYHFININGGNKEFQWKVWKECASNPIYPQGGTWIFDRAGWCPGAATDVKECDITPYVTPGQTVSIDYGLISASGTSKYLINNQLVEYGDTNFTLDAAVVDIPAPSVKVEYTRTGVICNDPQVIIRNTGKTPLTSAVIEYWVNNNSNKNTYSWSGNLKFLEEQTVTLPVDSQLWSSIVPGHNVFHAKVTSPNGGTDEYSHNDVYHSEFILPDVMPADFIIQLRTNKAGNENSYKLYDSYGNILIDRHGLSSNTTYRDTAHLGVGCYKLVLIDTDGDGLSFFANNDGNGSFMFKRVTGSFLKSFNPNFGNSIVYSFTVDYPLTYEELHKNDKSEVYPNPSSGRFNIYFPGQTADNIIAYDLTGKEVYRENITGSINKTLTIDLSQLPKGVYFLKLTYSQHNEFHKIVIR